MILFGHLGITVGAVKAAEIAAKRKGRRPKIDYRFVLLGSILPDLIDKPLGGALLRRFLHNTRLFAHSLLFSLSLLAAGFARLRRRGDARLLLTGVGSAVHLALDSMWANPRTFFWPFLGLRFPRRREGRWTLEALRSLLHDASKIAAELAGLAILLFLFLRALRRRRLGQFLRNGRL